MLSFIVTQSKGDLSNDKTIKDFETLLITDVTEMLLSLSVHPIDRKRSVTTLTADGNITTKATANCVLGSGRVGTACCKYNLFF